MAALLSKRYLKRCRTYGHMLRPGGGDLRQPRLQRRGVLRQQVLRDPHAVGLARQQQLDHLLAPAAAEDQTDGILLPLPPIVALGPLQIQLHLRRVGRRWRATKQQSVPSSSRKRSMWWTIAASRSCSE